MAKKKSVKKNKPEKTSSSSHTEKILIDNFVTLQKVMTNLGVKFDNLSDNIEKLLNLFEISAKAMAEKDFEKYQKSDSEEVLEKLDKLLEQNKVIARGLTMIHEKDELEPSEIEEPENMNVDKNQNEIDTLEGYQKSIADRKNYL